MSTPDPESTATQACPKCGADNGRIIADSAESYKNKTDCKAGIKLVQGSADATVETAK